MSERSKKVGANKLAEKRENLKAQLWGEELEELKFWHRKLHNGFTTVPRTMPQISRIMDKLAGKGTPVSSTYFSLWCNVFDESFLEVKDKMRLSFESGFSGERAVTTWTNRMRKLEYLGFIKSKGGASGDFNYVLILNPLNVIESLYKEKEKDDFYNALIGRMNEVGADFDK